MQLVARGSRIIPCDPVELWHVDADPGPLGELREHRREEPARAWSATPEPGQCRWSLRIARREEWIAAAVTRSAGTKRLRWRDVDWQPHRIGIHHTLGRWDGRWRLHAKAMARLDAILGRRADAAPRTSGDKGSNKGSPTPAEANEGPDPSVDRAENGEIGTAYRNRGESPAESD